MPVNVPMPIIKLEVEHMRHTLAVALSEYTLQFDDILQKTINEFCAPGNLQRIMNDEANKVLDQVIRDEVKNWFWTGEGREVIKKAVYKKLSDNETWTPLDYVKGE